jgi:hypothetical protein
MDIAETILDTKVNLSRPEKRYIGSKSKPGIIHKYKQYIRRQFQIHRIYERAEEIKTQAENGNIHIDLIQRLNNLDKQITEITLAAERSQCPKRQETEWSITINEQVRLCKYWAIVEKGIRNKIDTSRQSGNLFIQLSEEHQQKILEMTDYHHPNKRRQECRIQLKLATKYHKQLLRAHRELRHRGILCLKEVRKSEGNLNSAEIIRKMLRHELHNDDLSIVRALRNPKGTSPLSKHELYMKQWQSGFSFNATVKPKYNRSPSIRRK